MGPAIRALVGVLLQVTLASGSTDTRTAKNLKPGDVDRIISSALRQLSTAVYNNLSTDQKSSIEDVHFKLASLFNDLQELCRNLSTEPNDLAGLNTEARKILETVLESIYRPGSNNSLFGQQLQVISDISTVSDYREDAHTRPAPDSTMRNVNSTNLPKADRSASRDGDSQEPCVQNSGVFGEASSRYAFLSNAIDAERYGETDGAPYDGRIRELHTTLPHIDPNAWSNLIYLALMQAPGHQMSLQEIYTWMLQHTDKVKEPSNKAWKNSVRHNLSFNCDFMRVPNATPAEGCHTLQGWTIRPSAIERGMTSTTSHRKNTGKRSSIHEPEVNNRGNGDFVAQDHARVVPSCSAPQSILENHMTHSYYAERKRTVSEPFDRDIGNHNMDRHHSVTGSVKAGGSRSLGRCSSSFQGVDDVSPSIDGYGHAAHNEVSVGGNEIRIMFTQTAFDGFIRLWETYKQEATSTHESLNNNTHSKPDMNKVCSRLVQLRVTRAFRSGFGPLFDLYRARLDLVRFYEAYEDFKAQVHAGSTAGGKLGYDRAISLDDPKDPIALQRARNALAARKTRHNKNQLIEDLINGVKELEADLEQAGPGQESIPPGTDRIERDVSSIGVASMANDLLVDCLNARNGQSFTPKQRANQKKDIVSFSIEARKFAPFIKTFGLGILALMPQQCHFRFSKRRGAEYNLSPSPANTNVNSDTKQKSSNVERDILSFVNENPRSVDFCRIIEEEYMTIARNNNETTQSNPRHDVRLQIILASISLGNLRDRSQPDSLAKLPEPLPGQGADSRMVRGHMQESYSIDRLPCNVCKVKNIHCSYEIDPSACEECRKKKIRCIKDVPLGQHYQLSGSSSPCFVDTSMETKRDLGKSGTLQHRSVIDLTRDAGIAGPTLPGPNSYPGPALKCRRCGKTDHCAWCPGSDGYRFLCGICGHQYLMGKLGNTTPSVQPPINSQGARHFSPALNEKTEIFNGDVAVVGRLGTTSPEHQSASKKRRASASVAIQEDRDAIKRARNRERGQKHRAKKAKETSDLRMRNEALEAALALSKSAGGSG